MTAPILVVNPRHPEPRKIAQAAKVLDDGGVIFYPTDSVYALGAAWGARKAVERLYQLKQLDARRQLSIVCADLSDVARYAIVSDFAYRQLRRLLPGPYTVLLEVTREVPKLLLDKRRTIGLRVPENPICQALVRALGRPLLTTSAIPPGADLPCHDCDDAREAWKSGIDLLVDGGPTPGEPSTIVSLVGDMIEVIREGLGPVEGVLT